MSIVVETGRWPLNRGKNLLSELDGFPGRYELRIEAFRKDEPPPITRKASIWSSEVGYTFARMRELLGGDEGFLTDSRGDRHFVSLLTWPKDEWDNLRLLVEYSFVPEESSKDRFQALLRGYLSEEDARSS